MSRFTVSFRKKIGAEWVDNRGRQHSSGNRGRVEGIIPRKVVKDKNGNVCTLPMSAEKEQRIRSLLPKRR